MLINENINMDVCFRSEFLEEDNNKWLLIFVWNKEFGNR